MRESQYQAKLIERLETLFPGCFILKNDPRVVQGVPDIVILYWEVWAALEIKKSANAPVRPNQDYYVDKLDNLSFCAFIYPENEDEVLHELQRAFGSIGKTRFS